MKISVIQPLPGIGDMVWFVPAIKAIAATAPGGKITLLARPSAQAAALFANENILDAVVDLPPKKRGVLGLWPNMAATWRGLRQAAPDRLFILHPSPRYRQTARLLGIKEIIGFPPRLARDRRDGWQKSLQFLGQNGISIGDGYSRLAAAPDLAAQIDKRFAFCPRPWLILSPGASEPARRWPAGHFAALLEKLAPDFGSVFIVGSAAEAEGVNRIYSSCRAARNVIPISDFSFAQVMALMAGSAALIGNDSGPANVAAALGVPSFALCGVSRPPPHSPFQHLILPDGHGGAGMESITVDCALRAVRGIMGLGPSAWIAPQ